MLGLRVPGIRLRIPTCVRKAFPNFFTKLDELALRYAMDFLSAASPGATYWRNTSGALRSNGARFRSRDRCAFSAPGD
jgi:hypothetical protein